MTYTELQCPECGYNSFFAHFDTGIDIDPRIYLRLTCQQCKAGQVFVIDLTPEFSPESQPEFAE